MADTDVKAFPFLSLPAELRNNVYELLLCSFGEPAASLDDDLNYRLRIISTSSIDTTILRTSSQVHQEAYDCMIKKNRLVQVIYTKGLDLFPIVRTKRVPLVRMRGRDFQGFSMRVTLTSTRNLGTPQDAFYNYMFAQDLKLVCLSISHLQYVQVRTGQEVGATIEVALVLIAKPLRYKTSFNAYFSKSISEALLNPLRLSLRGMTKIVVLGCVLPELAKAVCAEVAQHEWSDPTEATEDIVYLKNTARETWKMGDTKTAYLAWCDAILLFRRVRLGSSWLPLMTLDGDNIIDKVAETILSVFLNYILISFKMLAVTPNKSLPAKEFTQLIEHYIDDAVRVYQMGYWKDGYTWRPKYVHLATLRYRQAQFCKLGGSSGKVMALCFIGWALQLLPGEPVLLQEWQAILAL